MILERLPELFLIANARQAVGRWVKGGQPRKSIVFLNTTTQTITSYRNKNWHVAKRTFPLPAGYGGMLKRVNAVRLCWHSAKSRQDIANYQLWQAKTPLRMIITEFGLR